MTHDNGTDHGKHHEHGVSGFGMEAKLSSQIPLHQEMLQRMAEEMMLAIADKCIRFGAKWIGHIKSHIKTEFGTIRADTLGTAQGSFSSGQISNPVQEIIMTINSIVQGISEQSVQQATLEGFQKTAESMDLTFVINKEQTFFDAYDLDHDNH